MLFMASFPHSGETLRGDEVRETESRGEGWRERAGEREHRGSNCTSLQSRSEEIPPHGPQKHSYMRCIITCVKSLNELTTRLSVESTRGTTDGL